MTGVNLHTNCFLTSNLKTAKRQPARVSKTASQPALLLFVCLDTLVQLDHVTADEPDQVTEVGHRRLVPDVVQHVLVVHWGQG